MKRNISLIFSLLFIFSACQKEEVEEYVSGARLNFNNDYKVENVPTIRCGFTDSDYLNKTTEITDSIEVVVMGLSTNTDRTFYCTTAPADSLYSMPVTVAESYIIPKNTYSTFIKFSIKAPVISGKPIKPISNLINPKTQAFLNRAIKRLNNVSSTVSTRFSLLNGTLMPGENSATENISS